MTTPQITLFAIFGAVMILMIWGKWRHDLIAFAGLMAGVLTGVVPAAEAFSGFGHPATMVVALVLVATAGLMRSGVVSLLTKFLSRPKWPVTLHIAVMGGVGAALSGFMNNIAALAILMPTDMQVARKAGRAAALTLMPLAFATILGGMLTMIGTPPNLLVSGFRQDVIGEPFRMFDFLPVGGAVAAAGLAFIALVGWRLIPRHATETPADDAEAKVRDYMAELVVPEGSSAIGKMVADLDESAEKADVAILAVRRGEMRLSGLTRAITLQQGDRLLVEAAPAALDEFRSDLRLAFPDGHGDSIPRAGGEGQSLVECVVPENARVVGHTARSLRLSSQFNTVLMGIQRRGRTIRQNLRQVRVEPGDILLLLVPEDRDEEIIANLGCLPLDGAWLTVTKENRMWLAFSLFLAAIGATTMGWITMPVALGCVTVCYVLFKILSLDEIYTHIDWPVIVLLGAMIPLGLALDTTGGSALLASGLAAITQGYPAWVALVLLMIATMTLSDVLNNNATTILAAPVGIRLAEQLNVNPDAFLMGVAVSASCAFLTPIGHQNNTLILGPGGYRFGDYWRMGLPLEVLVMAVSVPMLLIVWPL
ncbi:MAG: SLC13 family permease [Paracoccus sp. (in: a-proteobacteria)]|uniref:SLC13 family permease n=1 Tax=Paracoccus sp. TaxID=267 RepID=UPI0026DEF0D0|nr:SLC13 family permease [Paracoccus sp. (in: a-proteobacteria)]MDO5632619.1 SLC13 family permease [Paracoccus sp. (in: a-proteobacteria)]